MLWSKKCSFFFFAESQFNFPLRITPNCSLSLCSVATEDMNDVGFTESSLKMLRLYEKRQLRFWKQPDLSFSPLLSVNEFVQWVPHSFLKKRLLSRWDCGDFVLQLLYTHLMQLVISSWALSSWAFSSVLHSGKHDIYIWHFSALHIL